MKNLLNYCSISAYENDLTEKGIVLTDYLTKYNLDGIEQLIYGTHAADKDYSPVSVGVHLAYWPYWLGFWRNNTQSIQKQFKNTDEKNKYFHGAENTNEWLEAIKSNIHTALKQKPEYLVWHIADCSTETAYTFNFDYDDASVIKAAAEVFNQTSDCIPENVMVLFENLWWPGLCLLNKEMVKLFFSLINRENVGIMLDTGHLLNTNDKLSNQQQAVDYIYKIILNLGSEAARIKGMHLSCSLSGNYQRSFEHTVPEDISYRILLKHIVSIDQHLPFTNTAIQKILDLLQPEYVVHELNYKDFSQLDTLLPRQLAACGLL